MSKNNFDKSKSMKNIILKVLPNEDNKDFSPKIIVPISISRDGGIFSLLLR